MKRLFFLFAIIVMLINIVPIIILKFINPTDIEIELSKEKTIRVWIAAENKVEVMPLEEYLVGVVAAEMPASFSKEALKAQAIAARTYTVNKAQMARDVVNPSHKTADVCTNSLHCQAWISEDEQNKKWGIINSIIYRRKIKEAIKETQGMIITYKSKLIDPVYHSTCGGHTEDAGEVWQYDAPYLKGVTCDYCKTSPKYRSIVTYTTDKLDALFGTNSKKGMQIIERSSGGRVTSVRIGKKTYSGVEARSALNLNSANFSVKSEKDKVIFNVKGYGHGVGLCQYGAGGLANEGKNYEEILKYYYKGIKIIKVY